MILAGGDGTRLSPITNLIPKQLIPVANKPIIAYCVDDIINAGIRDIGIILGNNLSALITKFLDQYVKGRAKLTYIYQGTPRGIAHGIACAQEFVGPDRFVVYLGDNVLENGIDKMLNDHFPTTLDALLLFSRVKDPERFGIAQVDKRDGSIINIQEKPQHPSSDLAVAGIYFLTPAIFDIIDQLRPSERNELEITDALNLCIQKGHSVKGKEITGWWRDTGVLTDVLDVNRLVLDSLAPKKMGRNRILLGKNVEVGQKVKLLGPVAIENGAILKGELTLGPYVSVGRESTIENTNVQNSIICQGTHIREEQDLDGCYAQQSIRADEQGMNRADEQGMNRA